MQQIIDDNIKNVHLVTTLEYCALTWYINYCIDNPLATLAANKDASNKEFSKPKFDSQSFVGFKEITMRVVETP